MIAECPACQWMPQYDEDEQTTASVYECERCNAIFGVDEHNPEAEDARH